MFLTIPFQEQKPIWKTNSWLEKSENQHRKLVKIATTQMQFVKIEETTLRK